MTATRVDIEVAKLKAKLEHQRNEHPERFREFTPDEYIAARADAISRIQQDVLPANQLRYCGLYQDEIDTLAWESVRPEISGGIEAVPVLRAFYGQGYGMIYLGGSYGQAKTLMLKIVVAIATRQDKRARYIDLRDVLNDLKAGFHREYHRDEFTARMQSWIDEPILALDEIDKCNETDWAKEQIFYLLDKRYSAAVRQSTLTILAGNQTKDEMAGYLRSRLLDNRGAFLTLNGPDGRRVMTSKSRI